MLIALLISIFTILVLLVAWLAATERQRRTYLAFVASETKEKFQYRREIEILSHSALAEHFACKQKEMYELTQALHRDLQEAVEPLLHRPKWIPLKDTILSKNRFLYEIARVRFLVSQEHGPISISHCDHWKVGELQRFYSNEI